MYLCVCVYVLHVVVSVYVCVHTCVNVYVFVCVNVYVFVCVCVPHIRCRMAFDAFCQFHHFLFILILTF